MCLGVPGLIEEITGDSPLERLGKVRFGGIARQINLSLVPDAGVGDYVIVHVGIAISQIREEEAAQVFRDLEALDGPSGQE
ncbi:HypC/HybG/HupF family hydrogenase formation chaperone [Microbulbifer sp. THAF38]|uniref:HypC/HybG/HupF family hydrogenase formation chaperone n=1 Tax=Microbulbifer sp. THAF38 TaxID=2587856 RepID=UPI0012693CFA|nr:HypC/HybG/HupF family hydrogenase formation chaperone [Microbulbifer sp. THAF38]QFT54871.1 Hydrogenase isoenzymes formation protein HypC [Microbulbifer sp. THAF38]